MKTTFLSIVALVSLTFGSSTATAKHGADDDYALSYINAALKYVSEAYTAAPSSDSYAAMAYANYAAYYARIGDLLDNSAFRYASYLYASYASYFAVKEYNSQVDRSSSRNTKLYYALYFAQLSAYHSHNSLMHQ